MAIITISRGTFSGGKALAKSIAETLGYKCIAEEVLVKAAKRYGMAVEQLQHAINDKPGLFEGMTLERVHALAFVGATLCEEIKDENVVYHGHAGHLLLKDVPHVIRVRVIADMEYRIKAAMKRHGINRDKAIKFIKKADAERIKWTKFLFGLNLLDPSLYDLVINLERTSLASACELVCLTASKEEFQPTPKSQQTLDDLILATQVRARLASDNKISDQGIEIEADRGVITIKGIAKSTVDADKIRENVRYAPGVKDIKSELKIRN